MQIFQGLQNLCIRDRVKKIKILGHYNKIEKLKYVKVFIYKEDFYFLEQFICLTFRSKNFLKAYKNIKI